MANDVIFGRVSSTRFAELVPDSNTLYFVNDTKEIYLGDRRYAFGDDVKIGIDGSGDVVCNAVYDASTKTLTLKLGDASECDSLKDVFDFISKTYVQTINPVVDSPIRVESSDPSNILLDIAIDERHPGNVKLTKSHDGLEASVEFPEPTVTGVDKSEKVISLEDGLLKSTLSISTVQEGALTYVVLKGIDGEVISRFDASEFVKDGILDSVSLEYASDGSNDRILVFNFNTESGKQSIKLNVNDLVDVYTARQGGGIVIDSDNAIAIENEVDPSGVINTDVSPSFGETVTLHAVKYDSHGLITGQGDFRFTMPSIADSTFGGDGKLVTTVHLDSTGYLEGSAIDISTAIDSTSRDTQIPTAKAVYDAIENSRTVWHRL